MFWVLQRCEELVALAPDVIFSSGAATVAPLLQITRSVPIVFVGVVDPVGAGFVDTLARPGGNATGFILLETAVLAEAAPPQTKSRSWRPKFDASWKQRKTG